MKQLHGSISVKNLRGTANVVPSAGGVGFGEIGALDLAGMASWYEGYLLRGYYKNNELRWDSPANVFTDATNIVVVNLYISSYAPDNYSSHTYSEIVELIDSGKHVIATCTGPGVKHKGIILQCQNNSGAIEFYGAFRKHLAPTPVYITVRCTLVSDGKVGYTTYTGTLVPGHESGDVNKVLAVTGSGATYVEWVDPSTLPGGGGVSLPAGGKAGQFLCKKSDADNDVGWADFTIPEQYGLVTYDQDKTITIT